MLYFTLASKAYSRNLQYRGAHMVHNLASAMFGYMYACLWIGIGADHTLGEYGTQGMISYIAFTQSSLWISGFLTNGLGIPLSVRTGQIALDLMRPVHLFTHLMAREWGQIAYQFVYKSIPIYLLFSIVFSLHWPSDVSTLFYAALGLAGAAYLSICMNYIIGATSMWTTESSWLHWGNHAMMNLLAGFSFRWNGYRTGLNNLPGYHPTLSCSMYLPESILVSKMAPCYGEPCFGVSL